METIMDCFCSAVVAQWRGLGILSASRLMLLTAVRAHAARITTGQIQGFGGKAEVPLTQRFQIQR
jgi:hypothetical protein